MIEILKKLLDAALAFALFTLGMKTKEETYKAATEKALREEDERVMREEEVIRAKTRQLKETISDSWDDDGRVPVSSAGQRS